MADQIPSLKDLANSISGDIVERLKLSSSNTVTNMLMKELQSLSSSNKLLAKIVEAPNKKESNLPEMLSFSLKSAVNDLLKANLNGEISTNEPKSELEKIEKPKDVRIIGFDEQAIKAFKFEELIGKPIDLLTKTFGSFKKGIDGIASGLTNLKGDDGLFGGGILSKLVPAGTLTALAGAAGIIGGIATLVAAWNTQGPEKGTLELIGKVGLMGGLTAFAKTIFKGASKQLLKRIPIIGTLVSYGFAWQAFKNKDIPKGILELASGTLQLLDLVAPGLGTALSLGVDVLNAVLDVKAGGSSEEAGAKKTEILKEWVEALKDKVMSKIENIPILGNFIKIGKSLAEGKSEKALEQLTEIIPALHWVKTIVRSKTALTLATGVLSTAGNILTTIGDWMSEKISKLFSPILSFFTKNEKTALAEAEKLGENIVPKAKGILNPIKEAILNFGKNILEHLQKTFSPLTSAFGEIGENFAKKGTWLLDKTKKLLTPIGEGIEKLAKTLSGHLESIYTPVKNFFVDLGENVLKKGGNILEKAKSLLEPVVERVGNLGKTVLDHLGEVFKPVKNFLGNITDSLSKKASAFITPITEIVQSISSKLLTIGDDVFKVFKNTFGSMFGAAAGATVEGVAKTSLLGKLTGFLPKFLGSVGKFLKQVPFIGSILSIGTLASRLMSSDGPDWVGAAIETLSIISGIFLPGMGISLALDVINGVLDYQAEPGEDGQKKSKIDILGKWVSSAGTWLLEKLKKIPFIGPMIEFSELAVTNPIEGLKAMGKAFPNTLGKVVTMFESTFPNLFEGDTSNVGFTDIGTEITKWVYEKIKDWPVIGPLVRAWATFATDPLGVLKTLGVSFPVLGKILAWFDVKSEITKSGITFANEAIEIEDPFKKLNDLIKNKVKDYWKGATSWITDFLPSWMKKDSKADLPASSATPSPAAPSPAKPSPAPPIQTQQGVVGDAAIDPNGGLLVSSPKLGALYQLHKQDGVVAAPMVESKSTPSMSGKAETFLEKIAANTGTTNQNISNLIAGFNNLAKALERTLGESAKIPVVINTSSSQSQYKPSPSEYANAGNSDILNFRSQIVEGSRFKPA